MISYAQNHEDVLLNRVFSGQSSGFYIDVGANDPVLLSVTKHFSQHGWRGINIEPGPEAFRRLAADRPQDVNLNLGIAAATGELTLHECPANDALSTFSAEQAAEHRAEGHELRPRAVPVRTLDEVCCEHVTGTIDFLTIDVEGFELQVLSGANLRRWRPRVIAVEATRPSTEVQTHADWEPLVRDAGYLPAAFDGLNRYYVREEEPELLTAFAVPVNVTDLYEPYELVRVRQELEAKDSALHRANAENATLTVKLQTKESDLHAALTASRDLQDQLRDKETALHGALTECHALQEQLLAKERAHEETLRRVQERFDILNAALSERQQLVERLEGQLLEHSGAIDNLSADLRKTHAELQAERDAVQAKHASLHVALDQAADLQRALLDKHADLLTAVDRYERLRERNLWGRLRNAG